jgi:hypothetical protein
MFNAEEINEHGRVTDPGYSYVCIIPLRRLRFGKGGGNRPPTFDCPFPPKMNQPSTDSGAGWFPILHLAIHSTRAGKSAGSYYGDNDREDQTELTKCTE